MEIIKINVSVRELVSFSVPSNESRGSFLNKAMEGIEGHQLAYELLKKQIEEKGTYKKERSVSLTFQHEEYELKVSGRLDGLIEINGNTSVCEIKTTETSIDFLEKDDNPAYWAQSRCYAYMIAKELRLERISLLLVYYHRINKKIRSFEEELNFKELEKFFHSLVFPYINGIKKQHEWQLIRNQSALSLTFPFNEFRKGQRRMCASVYRAIQEENKQFIQAPTGIGKTIGALFPAIKAMGENYVDKLFYLTARNTTQAIALQAYETMALSGLRLKTLQITAKEKVCLSPGTPCTPEDCIYLSGYTEKSRNALPALFKEVDYFSKEFIESAARSYNLCPFELSLALSLKADLIVCDYNYAFDPRVYLKRFFQEKTDENICLMVDEAHNLPNRAREMYSAQLKRSQFRKIYRKIKNYLPDMAKALKNVRRAFLEYIKQLPQLWDDSFFPWAWSVPEPPEPLVSPIEKFLYSAEIILEDRTPYPFKEELISFFFDLIHFVKTCDLYGDNYTTFICREKGDVTLRLFCIDPAPMLKKRMEAANSSILFSATLSPPSYFKEVLGCGDKTGYLILDSPFPRKNLYLFVEGSISTKYKHRGSTLSHLVKCIHDTTSIKNGNYLVFFPSFSYMLNAVEEYQIKYPYDKLLVQETNMNEYQRQVFLDNFSFSKESSLIAFAVMGGIFGEGIDLKGELLSGAIIVGVGLPQICPERDIIKQYYQRKNGRGFDFAYTYPGLNKVQQAAGRVIRSEQDRGFVILIDDRFTTPLYKGIMPVEWFPLKTSKEQKNLSLDLKNFWNEN